MNRTREGKKNTVEILAPGGSMEGIRAAVNAGADAVYTGGSAFGARAYAKNLQTDELLEAIDYCHLHGARLYLTVNTLLKENELSGQLYETMAPVYEHGVDAVLVQDFGVFHFLKREFPGLPLHASTQMTVMSEDGVRLLKEMGASRVVLSRELSLAEIRKIRQSVDIELETFVHGALCYCYSGKCLMSSMIGGRSGNRGRCAQPCRLPYELLDGVSSPEDAQGTAPGRVLGRQDEHALLSPKDICTLQILPDLIDAGIASLKIEGRMKSPEYASGVCGMYRRYADLYLEGGRERYHVDPEDEKLLTKLFSRGPYSQGYYEKRNGRDMIVLKEPAREKGDALRDAQAAVGRIHDQYEKERKIGICASVSIHADEPMSLRVTCPDRTSAAAYGSVPGRALSRAAAEEDVRRQLMKTGDTPYTIESLTIDLEEGLFIPVRDLNVLRRSALDALTQKILSAGKRTLDRGRIPAANPAAAAEAWALAPAAPSSPLQPRQTGDSASDRGPFSAQRHPQVTASVCTMAQLESVLDSDRIGGVYLDLPLCSAKNLQKVKACGKKAYVMMPPVWRADSVRVFEDTASRLKEVQPDGYLLECYDQIGYFARRGMTDAEYIAGAGLYTWNREAREQLASLGITMDTLPYECTARELSARGCAGSECVLYGYLPLMVSAQCLTNTVTGCRHKSGIRYLKDRKGILFPVRNACGICTNTIYNSVPLVLTDLEEEIRALGGSALRYSFTVESGEQVRRIVNSGAGEPYTRGHFRKGVE